MVILIITLIIKKNNAKNKQSQRNVLKKEFGSQYNVNNTNKTQTEANFAKATNDRIDANNNNEVQIVILFSINLGDDQVSCLTIN